MIKRTGRRIAAQIYWLAATFVFLALLVVLLLPRARGQAGSNGNLASVDPPAYDPSITSQTATVLGVRSVPILMPPNFPRRILYDQYANIGRNATSSQDFGPDFGAFSDELAN